MSNTVSWTVTGTKLDDSADAFVKATQSVSNGKVLKKYEKQLNENFKYYIQLNMRRAGIGDRNFDDLFYLQFDHNDIIFVNTEPLITQRYEYGYYDKNDNDEYYDEAYMIETSPRYFIRPAIQQTMQDVGKIMIKEANNQYMQNRRQVNGDDVY